MSTFPSKIKIFLIAALFVFLLFFSYQIFVEMRPLQVIFLDVGQGDSILIQKGTRKILIDGGPSGKTELAELGKYLPYLDREIEIVMATHPDKDHIGGLVDVARNYNIGKVVETAAKKDTAVFREWEDLLASNRIEVIEALRGNEMIFDGAKIRTIFPASSLDVSAGDANNQSIVVRLDFGENSFLFTGDIEVQAEKEILAGGENIDVDFLKVAHHGSKYSTSPEFLDATSPREAVISVGANNSYGHPNDETLQKLAGKNIEILRTDEDGDIIYNCSSAKCDRKSDR